LQEATQFVSYINIPELHFVQTVEEEQVAHPVAQESQVFVTTFKNLPATHERQPVLVGPEQVRQVVSQRAQTEFVASEK
jgi:hypothetical protein